MTGPRRGSGDRNARPGTDVVPRKMLELCKNTLRRSLVRNVQLQDRVAQLEHEVTRLQQLLRAR
jgi:hypothetical protein